MKGRMIDILPMDKVPTKCKFCGKSLNHGSYPRFTQSDAVNSMCTDLRGCGAVYSGRYPDLPRWYTGKEWKEYVNG